MESEASIYYWLYCPRASDRQQFVHVYTDDALAVLQFARDSRLGCGDFATYRHDFSPETPSNCFIEDRGNVTADW